jgi:hypothetical protein
MPSKETMQQNNHWLVVVLIIASLQFSACQQKSERPAKIERARVEDSDEARQRVRLTAKRAEQLGIKTAPIREEQISGKLRKVVPSAAVVYDEQRNAWVFTSPDSFVFVQERIHVDHIEEGLAILASGPPVGAAVVTSGATSLFSDEFRVSTEERLVEIKEGTKGAKAIGMATMKEDGTIRVVYKTQGAIGLAANVVIEYKPTDAEYQKILDQVGGLKVGESKRIPSGPDL